MLAPSVAQAEDPVTLTTVTRAACPLTGFTDVNPAGSVTGGATFDVSIPATNGVQVAPGVAPGRMSVPGPPTSPRARRPGTCRHSRAAAIH